MIGIWNGDIDKGYKEWNRFNQANGLYYIKKISNIEVTTAYNAVENHQSTFASDQFRGVIDSRIVKNGWTDKILTKL